MKKILITLIAITFIGLSVNAQTKQAKTTPVATTATLIKDFSKAIVTTSLTKAQQASCREYYLWSLRNKERINNDLTLTAADKQTQLDIINKKVNEKVISILNASDLKILSPFLK